MATTRAERICEKDWDESSGIVTWDFGQEGKLELDYDKVPDNNKLRLALFGASEKGGNTYAGVKGNVKEAMANVRDFISTMYSGEWGAAREGGFRIGDLALALQKLKAAQGKHVDLETIRDNLTLKEGHTEEEKEQLKQTIGALRANKAVKAAIADIQAERARAELKEAGDLELPDFV